MHSAKDEKVQTFLDELQLVDPGIFDCLASARDIIYAVVPQVVEKIMYGGIIFSLDSDMFAGLFAYKSHTSLEFSKGYLMKDPDTYLEGKGKYRRHLKLKQEEDVIQKHVEFYVKQSV